MADNYLEKRYEEVFGSGRTIPSRRKVNSLDSLIERSRDIVSLDAAYPVHPRQMEAVAAVVGSRLRCLTATDGCPSTGGAMVILFDGGTDSAQGHTEMEAGMAVQRILLKAADIGLGARVVEGCDGSAVKEKYSLPCPPLAVVAVGKPIRNR